MLNLGNGCEGHVIFFVCLFSLCVSEIVLTSKRTEGFLLWLIGFRTRPSVCEGARSTPGLAQWVKDPALPKAAA